MPSSAWFPTDNANIVYQTRVIQNSQNVANNTSNVTVEVWAKRTNTGYETYGSGTVYCKINGATYTSTMDSSDKVTSTAIKVFTKTLTISHNADGTKTLATDAKIDHSRFTSSYNDYDVTLTTIPRASSFSSLTSSVSVDGANEVAVSISRASSSFTHNMLFQIGAYSHHVTGIATSYSYAIPTEWLNAIPNSTSGTVTVTLSTYSGSTKIGSTADTFTITAPSTVVPSFSALNLTRINGAVPTEWDVYVQGKSALQAAIAGEAGAYSSTINARSIVGGGYSGSTATLTTGFLNTAGVNTFTATITDSRGRTATRTVTATVEPYANPNISVITAQRCLSDGTLNDDGTYVKVTVTDAVSSVAGHNTATRAIKYRRVGVTEWTSAGAYTSGTPVVIGGGLIDVDYAYEVQVSVQDAFSTVTATGNIPTAFTTMDFLAGGKGIAIGKVASAEGLEVDMEATFNKPVTVYDDISASGDIYCDNIIPADDSIPMGKLEHKVYGAVIATATVDAGGYVDTTVPLPSGWTAVTNCVATPTNNGARTVYLVQGFNRTIRSYNDTATARVQTISYILYGY